MYHHHLGITSPNAYVSEALSGSDAVLMLPLTVCALCRTFSAIPRHNSRPYFRGELLMDSVGFGLMYNSQHMNADHVCVVTISKAAI